MLYDGTDLVHYYDGEEVIRAPRNPATVGTTLIIGAEPDRDNWFTGLVDEVAIFNVALAGSDIKPDSHGDWLSGRVWLSARLHHVFLCA